MAKKNITNTATAEVINNVTITINQRLHGIEVKGNTKTGELNAKDDKWVRENGFFFSKRKGHYWIAFDAKLYKKVCDYFREQEKAVEKKAKAKTEAKKSTTKSTTKKEVKKSAPAKKDTPKPVKKENVIDLSAIQTHPKGDDLEEWKRLVILAVEKIIDEAIETMAAEVA